MTLVEGLTVAGLVLGPLVAVLISFFMEHRRQVRLRKLNAIRMLLIGRLNFADPSFQVAINSVPVDFPREERVLAAWEAYLAAVQVGAASKVDELSLTHERWEAALSNLLTAMLTSAGYNERASAQIARSRYVSTSSADLSRQQREALQAVVQVAENTGRMADVNEKLLNRMPPPPQT